MLDTLHRLYWRWLYGACKDCGLHKERENRHEERCELCRWSWNQKMKELGGAYDYWRRPL